MSDLIRFGVSLEKKLLDVFDKMVKHKGYSTRSEAIRDLIREKIVTEQWEKGGSAGSIGTINIVYEHHTKGLNEKLTAIQHDYHGFIVSDTHVHLDHDNCLDVIIVKGPIGTIRKIADKLISVKGVKYGKLSVATKGRELK